jgi:hypothetical protein
MRYIHLLEGIGPETVDGLKIVRSVEEVATEIIGQGEKIPETVLGGGEMVLLTRNQRAEETTAGTATRGRTLAMHRTR